MRFMNIPDCENDEQLFQVDHCWHPGSNSAMGPQSQRCCHCGLGFKIIRAPFQLNKKHGKHGAHHLLQNYQIEFDTTYQEMYKKDPERFKKLWEALEEGAKIREQLYKKKTRS